LEAIQEVGHSGAIKTTVFFGPYGAPDYKAQYQKLNVSCSFFIHRAHRIIRRVKWSKT